MNNKRDFGAELIESLKDAVAYKRGELKLKSYEINLPSAADVPAIRAKLKLSQPAFAAFMGVSAGTLRNWEQQRREPQGPARALLQVASAQPQAVMAALQAAVKVSTARKSVAKKRPAKLTIAGKASSGHRKAA